MDIHNTGISAYKVATQKSPSKCDLLEQAFLENYLKTSKALQASEGDFSFIFYQEISKKISEKMDLNFGCIDDIQNEKGNSR